MLVELAIGDAYGAGFEYAPGKFVEANNTLEGYVAHPWHRGQQAGNYTDDTQMSLAVGSCSHEFRKDLPPDPLRFAGAGALRLRLPRPGGPVVGRLEFAPVQPSAGFEYGGVREMTLDRDQGRWGVTGLGAVRQVCRSSPGELLGRCMGFVILSALPLAAVLVLFLLQERWGGLEWAQAGPAAFLVPGCSAFILLGLLASLIRCWTWPLAVAVFDDGIAVKRIGRLRTVRWDEVDRVMTRRVTGRPPSQAACRYRIIPKGGRPVVIDEGITSLSGLGRVVEREVTARTRPVRVSLQPPGIGRRHFPLGEGAPLGGG